MPTIIDGYNLIFTCGLEGKTRTPQTLERSRARLISILAKHFDEAQRKQITIVFDAKRLPIKETQADSRVQGIRIIFAIDYEDADTLIEELIRKHSTPKKLTVVSSDHRIQTAATRRKATAIDSDVWLEDLSRRSVSPTRQTNALKNVNADTSAIEQSAVESLKSVDWLKEFSQPIPNEENSDPPDSSPNKDNFNPFPDGYGEDLLEDVPD